MDKGKIIGLSAIYANDSINHIGYISLIGIKKEYQNRGLGKELLQETLSFMKEKGMKECRLEVDKENLNALSF